MFNLTSKIYLQIRFEIFFQYIIQVLTFGLDEWCNLVVWWESLKRVADASLAARQCAERQRAGGGQTLQLQNRLALLSRKEQNCIALFTTDKHIQNRLTPSLEKNTILLYFCFKTNKPFKKICVLVLIQTNPSYAEQTHSLSRKRIPILLYFVNRQTLQR